MMSLKSRPGLGDQRRVGGDPVEQARCGQFLDFGHVGRIDEEFHFAIPFRIINFVVRRRPDLLLAPSPLVLCSARLVTASIGAL